MDPGSGEGAELGLRTALVTGEERQGRCVPSLEGRAGPQAVGRV